MWMEQTSDGKFKYRERYTDPYTEKYRTVSITLLSNSRQAQNKAQRYLNDEINKRLTNKVERSDTFKNVLKEWLEKYKHTVKETTYWRNEWNVKLIRRFLQDDIIVKNIDAPLIQKGLDKLYYEDNYSLSTVKNCKSLIRIILEYARSNNLIDYNPVNDVSIHQKVMKYEELEKIESKYLEKEELKKILHVQRDLFKSKRFADLAEFMALTGVRFGEAIALDYSCLNGNTLNIDGTLDYTTKGTPELYKTLPKTTAAIRKIELNQRAIDILSDCRLENSLNTSERFTDKGFFFSSLLGNPIALSNFNDSLKRAANHAGINKNVSSHILRHTHISMLAEKRIPIKAIMERVGHTDAEITTKIYTHVTEEMKRDIIEALEEIDL
ncbi:tyrosine-type recombinase/integrase [Candidatus Enterococcus ikei]|uniref:Site-specific integrase n=1 Tax=Candidatus Enterococcus ikei TaxID=2815326 RepID=A0ABS3GUI3_9ENTE|nr:site-specific integrase [Enterococcus sp. DIV0869a]MBO0438917.1 site-specific integrase [Enterococcus sp. DIV0869a]